MEEEASAKQRRVVRLGASWVRYYLLVAGIAALLVALAAYISILNTEAEVQTLIREYGPVETASALGYLACMALIFTMGGFRFFVRHYYVSVLLLFLALRELDFHVRFTTSGIFKTSFYLAPEVPLMEKLAAAAITGLLVWSGIKLVAEHWRGFFRGLLVLHPAVLAVVLAGGSLVLAKLFDGSQRTFAQIGITIDGGTAGLLYHLEEVLELGAPLFLVAAALCYFAIRRREGRPS